MKNCPTSSCLAKFLQILLLITIQFAVIGCSSWAGTHINWEVLTKAGKGIPEIEIADNVILGSREELIFSGGMTKNGKRVVCVRSLDGGRNWEDVGTIVESPDIDIDLGDGSMLHIKNVIYYIYRYNRFSGKHRDHPSYSIRIKQSVDGGKTWKDHSIVEEISPPKSRKSGLWTPRLFYSTSGNLQAFYDDGDLPERMEGGANHGQWGVMKTWNESSHKWEKLVIVSRPPISQTGPLRITADGARTPIELRPGHIWSPVESAILDDTPGSRSLVLRYAESFDYGLTWSWSKNNWPILHELPPKRGSEYYDWSWPLATQLKDGGLVVVFRSNEKAKTPTKGTAHQTDKTLFYLLSLDKGKSWTKGMVFPGVPIIDHGLTALNDGSLIVGFRNRSNPKNYTIIRGTF